MTMNELSAWPVSRLLTGVLLACLWLSAGAADTGEVQALVKKGELRAALQLADAGLESNTDDVQMRFLRGLILARLERFDEAEKEFLDLIEKHPKLPEPYNNLAVVYAAQGEYEKARETLLRAINTHPSYATAYENIGDIYAKMASDAYNQALQLDTRNTAAREKLALVNDLFSVDVEKEPAPAPAAEPKPRGKAQPQPQVAEKTGPEPEPEPEPKRESAPEPEREPARPTAEMPGPVVTGSDLRDSASRPAPAAEQAPARKPDTRDIVQAVRQWASAWSAQDVETYLGFYAGDFAPPDGLSRNEWEAQRHDRVGSPEYIRLDIDNIRVNTEGKNRARVVFRQDYESNTYSDSVTKTLLMKYADNRWLIAEEISE